jgi:hypothetical protein
MAAPRIPSIPSSSKMILGKEKPIDHRPADDLKPILPIATKNISKPELITSEEDIISYCLFPEVATEYFQWRAMPENIRPKSPADLEIESLCPGLGSQPTLKRLLSREKEAPKEPMLHTSLITMPSRPFLRKPHRCTLPNW